LLLVSQVILVQSRQFLEAKSKASSADLAFCDICLSASLSEETELLLALVEHVQFDFKSVDVEEESAKPVAVMNIKLVPINKGEIFFIIFFLKK